MNSSFIRQKGSAFVLVILSLIPILALAAFAVDINYILYERTRLQSAADAGALAGIVKLPDATVAVSEAITVVMANYDPESIYLSNDDIDVTPGCWAFSSGGTGGSLNESCTDPNAIRVVVQRGSNPVNAFFGHLLGFENYEIADQAVAYLSGSPPSGTGVCAALCKNAYDDHVASGGSCLTIIQPIGTAINNVRRINNPDLEVVIGLPLRTRRGNSNCLTSSGSKKFALIDPDNCSDNGYVDSIVLEILVADLDVDASCAEFSNSSSVKVVLVN